MHDSLWSECLDKLKQEITEQEIITWISPLHIIESKNKIELLAPNTFVMSWIKDNYFPVLKKVIKSIKGQNFEITLGVGAQHNETVEIIKETKKTSKPTVPKKEKKENLKIESNLNPNFTFDTFIEGNSNRLAKAAALQIAENPGKAYNPLFIYGDVGLGKTHLMHATGSLIRKKHTNARILYLHSERFVDDMIKALQYNSINQFKQYYRNLDVLLIDDIQFLSDKERSQEEFFYTFNALLECQAQVVLTSDRYPKNIQGLEERLTSRFGSGLTTAIEPPGLETRVAILHSKAEQNNIFLSNEVAFFIAEKVDSNVRELEGALRRIIATSNLTGNNITLDIIENSLKDIISPKPSEISIEFIQKTIVNYYDISLIDLLSDRRDRQLARPRQMAMSLIKELTAHSLPEIGKAFNGRDHTTVLHACKKIQDLRKKDSKINDDYLKIKQKLTEFD